MEQEEAPVQDDGSVDSKESDHKHRKHHQHKHKHRHHHHHHHRHREDDENGDESTKHSHRHKHKHHKHKHKHRHREEKDAEADSQPPEPERAPSRFKSPQVASTNKYLASSASSTRHSDTPLTASSEQWKQRLLSRMGSAGSMSSFGATPTQSTTSSTTPVASPLTKNLSWNFSQAASRTAQEAPIAGTNDAESSSSSSNSVPAPPPVQPQTSQQHTMGVSANKLAAQAMKAKVKGNMEEYARLMAQVEQLRGSSSSSASSSSSNKESSSAASQLEASPRVQAIPELAALQQREKRQRESDREQAPYKRQRLVEEGVGGERQAYFKDDNASLDALVARERMQKAGQYDDNYARNIMNRARWVQNNKELDDEELNPEVFERKMGKRTERDPEAQAKRDRERMIQEHRRVSSIHENCADCVANGKVPDHLVLAVGVRVYLRLVSRARLTRGHCQIVPIEHHVCTTRVDEDIYEEMRLFQRCLQAMFKRQERDIVVMETAVNLNAQRHMVWDVVPLPADVAFDMPIYFQKALMECEGEWAQHKKVIDTKAKGGIRRSVPEQFAYFHVEFGTDGGYAHAIENERDWSWHFGHEIIGGVLDLAPGIWRKPKRAPLNEETEQVQAFRRAWEPFDFTKRIPGRS